MLRNWMFLCCLFLASYALAGDAGPVDSPKDSHRQEEPSPAGKSAGGFPAGSSRDAGSTQEQLGRSFDPSHDSSRREKSVLGDGELDEADKEVDEARGEEKRLAKSMERLRRRYAQAAEERDEAAQSTRRAMERYLDANDETSESYRRYRDAIGTPQESSRRAAWQELKQKTQRAYREYRSLADQKNRAEEKFRTAEKNYDVVSKDHDKAVERVQKAQGERYELVKIRRALEAIFGSDPKNAPAPKPAP